jgi:murein endopeptidase
VQNEVRGAEAPPCSAGNANCPQAAVAPKEPAATPRRKPTPEEDQSSVRPHPLAAKTNREIDAMVREDIESLGSMSFGSGTQGRLLNAVQLRAEDRWELVDPAHAWGTEETVRYLEAAVDAVRNEFPNTPRLYVGHISARNGGRLKPHLSHQAGEDVDLGFYYNEPAKWYTAATSKNLDRARTWALVRALLTKTDVRVIFIDTRIQRWLREYAESIGEAEEWLESVFVGSPELPAVIRQWPGHATHIHVRFFNPIAGETARRCYGSLVRYGKLRPAQYFVQHKVVKGDSLISLAKRYRTTVDAIKRANGMRGNVIQAKKSYKIPQVGSAAPGRWVRVPARRLPPRPPTGRLATR